MKVSLLIASLLLPFAAAEATVTLNFSGGSGVDQRTASNFLDHLGGNTARVWGIIVDTSGNGFNGSTSANSYDNGFNLTATNAVGGAEGQFLSLTNGGLTDDRLFISQNLSVIGTTQDGAAGVPFLTQIAGINYGTGETPLLTAGMKFALVWFEAGATGTATTEGQYYGLYHHDSMTLPADPSLANLFNAAAFQQGLDPARLANLQLGIPEPSAVLLGGLGLFGLLRRRRG